MPPTPDAGPGRPGRRAGMILLGLNAVVAWAGLAISLTLTVTGANVHLDPTEPTLLGNLDAGTPGARVLDWLTYFTIWSNIVVAVVTTALVARPALFDRIDRVGGTWRALRLDSVVMITVTGVLYNLLLATGGKTGWLLWSNAFLHIITPLVTVLAWIVAGPRGLVSVRVVAGSLVLPAVWTGWALARGAAVGAYPYPFLDVAANGYPSVLAFLVGVVAATVLLGLVLLAVDRGLLWTARAGGTTS